MNNAWRRLRVHHGLGISVMGEPTWKAAFASSDWQHVNQHFGMATGFAVYEIAPEAARLHEVLQFVDSNAHNCRVGERVQLLDGCRLLFCVAIGEAAKRQLADAGMTVLVVESGTAITFLLNKLQEQSVTRIPRRKSLPSAQAEEKFLAMLANGWDE